MMMIKQHIEMITEYNDNAVPCKWFNMDISTF